MLLTNKNGLEMKSYPHNFLFGELLQIKGRASSMPAEEVESGEGGEGGRLRLHAMSHRWRSRGSGLWMLQLDKPMRETGRYRTRMRGKEHAAVGSKF